MERTFLVKVLSNNKSWNVRRTFKNFRLLDRQLHKCIFDRKFSQLVDLGQQEENSRSYDVSCSMFAKIYLLSKELILVQKKRATVHTSSWSVVWWSLACFSPNISSPRSCESSIYIFLRSQCPSLLKSEFWFPPMAMCTLYNFIVIKIVSYSDILWVLTGYSEILQSVKLTATIYLKYCWK
jgi:hypothetical protein